MAGIFAYYYVHRKSVGNRSDCELALLEIEKKANELFENGYIEGYELLIIASENQAEDSLVWCNYTKVTAGRFPFLCAIIQPFESHAVDIDNEMAKLNFVRCAEI